jgi:pilus assembly protein CpaB
VDRKAILIASITAAIGGACLFAYMKRFEAETSGGEKVEVLIATRDLKLGEKLDKSALGIRKLPQSYIEQRHIRLSELDAVLGAQLSLSVHANESILWSDLSTTQAERRDLSGLIQPGMRAFAFFAKKTAPFAGLLRPGDRVDVLYSPGDKLIQGGTTATITLLQNVLVLAVGTDVGGGDKSAQGGRAVTVSLTPEQAQVVTHAMGDGQLDVVLRNPEDIVVLKDLPETTSSDLHEPARRQRFVTRSLMPQQPEPSAQADGAPRAIDQVKTAK